MSWSLAIATLAVVFVAGVTCSPIDVSAPATELLPPRDESVRPSSELSLPETTLATDLLPPSRDDLPTISTDLLPPKIDSESTFDTSGAKADDVPIPATDLLPPLPPTLATGLIPPPESEKVSEKKIPAALFLINVFAVKNHTAEDSNDVLHSDVMKEVDSDDSSSEPLAMFLLVVEDEDENSPVSLDDVAKDLEEEGFSVEKIGKDGATRIIKVDLSSAMAKAEEEASRSNMIERVGKSVAKREARDNSEEGELEESGRLLTIRRKRHLCLKCKLEEIKQKKFGGGGCGGGCGGGGGGYYPPPQPHYPPPQVHYPPPQVHYPPPQVNYPPPRPPPQYCDPCQNGGGRGGGNSNSYAQASAQASASSSSYGK